MWDFRLIQYWCEHYYPLRDYELNPFEQYHFSTKEIFVSGSNPNLPNYAETCDLNWEFDEALTKLGDSAKLFKLVYLDEKAEPTRESKIIYNEFYKFLTENNNANNP